MDSNFSAEIRKFFEKFPGIGPRQANRFLWSLLNFSDEERSKFAGLISSLDKNLKRCGACFRVFTVNTLGTADSPFCSFCSGRSRRDSSKIMVLERDNDLLNIEKSGAYKGLYHVLGGLIDPLDENPIVRERIKKLFDRLKNTSKGEVILALSPTKLGEFTANYTHKVLEPLNVKITRLARGLSTGVELEYADEYTLRHALDNRK